MAEQLRQAKLDVQTDFSETAARIVMLPCQDSYCEHILQELSRWNNPGTSWDKTTSRFLNTNRIVLRPTSWSNHPARLLFKAVKGLITGKDKLELRRKHWNEIVIDHRWRISPSTPLFPDPVDPNSPSRVTPLFDRLKKCAVGTDRGLLALGTMHSHILETVNRILAASGESAYQHELECFIGKFNSITRPVPQSLIAWRSLTTDHDRRVAVWTLAVTCSVWGLEFVDTFLQFCTALLVGPVCGVSREECQEAFAACVAVATAARARVTHSLTSQEVASCTRAMWVFGVIELACSTAHGTLYSSRHVTQSQLKRVSVTACNKWETPTDPNVNPINGFCVVGVRCNHERKANEDGSFGVACGGRWIVVTKLEDLGEQVMQDHIMRVTLTHGNGLAANNILALLEKSGQWAYVQGQEECLSCAYKRALRHGFPVIIDGCNL